MAELASPESWCTGNGTVGSNPTPSAGWGLTSIRSAPDGVMDHELFHLFGFQHSPESTHPFKSPLGVGHPMTVALTHGEDAAALDIDALRCIFPEGG